jgi:hypothetical protein
MRCIGDLSHVLSKSLARCGQHSDAAKHVQIRQEQQQFVVVERHQGQQATRGIQFAFHQGAADGALQQMQKSLLDH